MLDRHERMVIENRGSVDRGEQVVVTSERVRWIGVDDIEQPAAETGDFREDIAGDRGDRRIPLFRFCSIAVDAAAPREIASNEKTPLPAKRSRKFALSMRGPAILKKAMRARSEVGRVSWGGTGTRRPRNVPVVTRSVFSGWPPRAFR
jgi:hypothetical protein